MAGRAAVDLSDVQTFDMTPMIDIVFQLVVFLMIANDMSRREIEELALPVATRGTEDGGPMKDRVVVNLVRDAGGGPPTVRVRGVDMDLSAFERHLGAWGPGASVLIRADRDCRWQDVQWVMQACAGPRVGLHRIEFATRQPVPIEEE